MNEVYASLYIIKGRSRCVDHTVWYTKRIDGAMYLSYCSNVVKKGGEGEKKTDIHKGAFFAAARSGKNNVKYRYYEVRIPIWRASSIIL